MARETTRSDQIVNEITRVIEGLDRMDTVFVPAWYARKKLAALRKAGFRPVPRACASTEFVCSAYAIHLGRKSARGERLKRLTGVLFGRRGKREFHFTQCFHAARIFPLLLPANPKAVILNPRDAVADDAELCDKALAAYQTTFQMLASISGCEVRVHLRKGLRQAEPPSAAEEGVIHVRVNVSPQGGFGIVRRTSLFGDRIAASGEAVWCTVSTAGRGKLLDDGGDAAVVQIVDDTWYLLFPIITYFHGKVSVRILRRALARAWNDYRERKPPKRRSARRRAAECAALVDGWFAKSAVAMDERVEKVQRDITQTQQQLENLYAKLLIYVETRRMYQQGDFMAKLRERLPGDIARISRDSRVASLDSDEGGIVMRLQPVVIAHGGHEYLTGTYAVRVNEKAEVVVWCEQATHYDEVPHPHIGIEGTPCYGTASGAIARAAGEFRIADLLEHYLQWLTRGYSHEHALLPITQWPRVGEKPWQYVARLMEMGLVPRQPLLDDDDEANKVLAAERRAKGGLSLRLLDND